MVYTRFLDQPDGCRPLLLLVLLSHLVEEFLDCEAVDVQDLAKRFQGKIDLSFFDAPVMDAWQFIIEGETFVTGVPF
jgi:hypothetical protein